MAKVYFSKKIEKILEKIDFSKLGKRVAIKLHFGEKGCVTYINPEIVKKVYKKIIDGGKDVGLVDCNVLYRGERTQASSHIKLAKEHGFDFAPIEILDGEKGDEFIEVNLKKGFVSPVRIGKRIKKYDSMIVLSHFKGHCIAGFGGAIKNIGMGLGSRAGKLQMHSDMELHVDKRKCIGCGICIKNCNFNAIELVNKKAEINPEKCSGCAMCIAVCPEKAVKWRGSTSEELQEKIVDYADGVFRLIPKEKIIFINVLENITKNCDCMGAFQQPMMDDIGILMSDDIVAVDKASLDLVNSKSGGKFNNLHGINCDVQINYAFEKGLGKKEYEIISLDDYKN